MIWVQSLYKRIGFSKQKATTTRMLISSGFLREISFMFYQSTKHIVDTFEILHDLIINLDQTPLTYCLVNQYMMAKKGSKLATIAGSADINKSPVSSVHSVDLSKNKKEKSRKVFVSTRI